jgi:integrase
VAGRAAGGGADDPQVGMAVALLYFTGQRINEVVKMSWRDIRRRHMRVYVQKTEAAHRGRDPARACRRCSTRLEKTSVTILTNANGQPWTQSGCARSSRMGEGSGFKVVPHGLRKNAVISLLEAGCTV